MTTLAAPPPAPPYARDAADVVTSLESDADEGLTSAEATARLSSHGPNEIESEPPPSIVQIALQQLRDPMNLMLVAVTIASLVIGEVSTGRPRRRS